MPFQSYDILIDFSQLNVITNPLTRKGGFHKPGGGSQMTNLHTSEALFFRNFHKGGKGVKIPKNLSTWFMDSPKCLKYSYDGRHTFQ